MSDRVLDRIETPADLRALPRDQVARVAEALRAEIVERVSRTGGHLASSLGAVELITALHYVFDTPRDRVVFDVGHQAYAHKMLTGRRAGFASIGRADGIAKFLRRAESAYDHFGAGHAGTSISAALGMAQAMQHAGRDTCAIAVIGDGGMTAGMAFEALNHAGHLKQRNLLVVLNDNEMSISPNVGAMSSYLSRKLSAPMVRRMKGWAKEFLGSMPGDMLHWAQKAEESLKVFFSPGLLFEALGFKYVGPIQGHRIEVVLETFENVKQMLGNGEGPVLVHAITAKGHGYEPAERDPVVYHGPGPFEIESGKMAAKKPGPPPYQTVFAQTLIRLAEADERICAITAAMADGTGLSAFERRFPERFYDVGIAEQHAVTFAAGLAAEGMKPVAAIYSTFLQRAYDQVVHDVCVQNLDVTLALDRAGLVGADGATHQGFYDLAYLRTLPNMIVMAPKDENELQHMLRTAVEHPVGVSELLRDGDDALVVALGTLVHPALEAASALASDGFSVAVLNARFAKPLDASRIASLAQRCGAVVTAEEHSGMGGFGSAVLEALAAAQVRVPVRCVAVPDRLIEHHTNPAQQKAELGLDVAGIARAVEELIRRRKPR
jgi:1-deoxy-D-xylulose-5-phosphate synthase